MTHIVLLGDSIFDNGAYTGPEPDVIAHLRTLLPDTADATLIAVDGATTSSLAVQCARIPADSTHLVVSIGGNDALGHAELLEDAWRFGPDPLRHLGERVERFERDYREALAPVFAVGVPVTVCTIYNGALPDSRQAARARVALALFNDVILRVAFEQHATAIDLRLVCGEAADYANPIEPSGPGGRKIAEAITRATGVRPAPASSRVYR